MNKYIFKPKDETIIKINNLAQQSPNESHKLLENHLTPIGTANSIPPNLNDKLAICCYWSLILGISGTLIGSTIWCLIKYYE